MTILVVLSTYAQKTSTGSGAWNVAGTWTPAGVPSATDDVTIAAGHIVTVPANAVCRRLFVNGSLNMTGTSITLDITNNSMASPTNGIQLGNGSTMLIGATNVVYFSNGQASGIVNNGGTIVSTGTNGVDGGTIRANTNSGGQFGISGSAATTVYNLEFLGNADFRISSGGLFVNGTLSEKDNNFTATNSALSPVYGPASTLYINNNNQGISGGGPLNNPLNKLWSAQTGTVGVTPGYPNNVTLVNFGTSSGNVNVPPNVNVGWRPGAIAIGLNGTLRIGDGTLTMFASLDQITSLNCGGISIENNSFLVGPPTGATFTNRGDFTLQGTTTGLFYSYGATINFAGAGTSGAPQIISTTDPAGQVTFSSMTVSSGTYVRLDDDVNISNMLTLSAGYIGTSAANALTITNTATNAIAGGGLTAYVDGPLSWSLPATASGNYVFPIGDLSGGAYLPLTFSSANSSGGTVLTAEGFNQNCNGTWDGSINSISQTEYWSVTTTNPFNGGTLVDATRPNSVSPYNALGVSATAGGEYTVSGGSPIGSSILDGGVGAFIVMVDAMLNPVRQGGAIVGVDGNCNLGTGSLIVGGVGGNPAYQYSLDGGPFQSGNTFSPLAKGPYDVTIKDQSGNTSTKRLSVLGQVQINGNDQNDTICVGESSTLTATNLANSSATYSWTSNPASSLPSVASIAVSPTVTTTYTVTSTVYANNLLTNGSFEGGSTPTGFSAGYTAHPGGYGTTPNPGGFYKIGTAGNQLCTFFTGLAAQSGTSYFIADGQTSASDVFTLNVTGLTNGTVYKFSFWYAEGSNDIDPLLRVQVDGNTLGTITVDNYLGWKQANYSFAASGTTATIVIRDMVSDGTTNGNDFYIDNMELLAPCIVTTSVAVVVDPAPNPTITGTTTFCGTSLGEVYTVAPGSPASNSYVWSILSGSNASNLTGQGTRDITVDIAGTSQIRVVERNGSCSEEDTITITVTPTTVDAGPDQVICRSSTNSATLAAVTPGGTWSGNTGLIANASLANTQVSGLSAGANTFTWTVSTGPCPGSNDVVITVIGPDPVITGAPTSGCTGTSLSFDVADDNSATNTYQWTYAAGSITSVSTNPSVDITVGNSNGILVVTETEPTQSCAWSDTIDIKRNAPSGEFPLAGIDRYSCVDAFSVSANDVAPSTGAWTMVLGGTGTFLSTNDSTISVTGFTDTTSLVWTVTGSCGFLERDTITIYPSDGNLIVSTGNQDQTLCEGARADITAYGSGGSGSYTFNWSSKEGIVASSQNVTVTPAAGTTTYYVQLSDNIQSGCVSNIDSVEITVVPAQELIIPNLVTPNGDDKNDLFEVRDINNNAMLPGSTLLVTNRWGDSVYKDSNYENNWLPASLADGVYYYHLKAGCGAKEYKGWLQVVR